MIRHGQSDLAAAPCMRWPATQCGLSARIEGITPMDCGKIPTSSHQTRPIIGLIGQPDHQTGGAHSGRTNTPKHKSP